VCDVTVRNVQESHKTGKALFIKEPFVFLTKIPNFWTFEQKGPKFFKKGGMSKNTNTVNTKSGNSVSHETPPANQLQEERQRSC